MLFVLQEFSDWAQCQVLELVAHYTPGSDAEVCSSSGGGSATNSNAFKQQQQQQQQ